MKKRIFMLALVFLLLWSLISCAPVSKRSDEDAELPKAGPMLSGAGWQKVAENDRFLLEVDAKEARIRLSDAEGKIWETTPDGYEEDESSRGSTKRLMESLLQVQFSDQVNNLGSANSASDADSVCYLLESGVRFVISFSKEETTILLDLFLRPDGLRVSVPLSGIEEKGEKYQVTAISLMPYFGAAANGSDGYLLVPDGSGALIDLDRRGKSTEDYTQYVYGREPAALKLEKTSETQQANLPVFGIKNAENALFAVMSEGDARGVIQASMAGKRSNYTALYGQFILRDSEMVTVEKTGQTVRVIEQNPDMTGNFTIDYYFLNGETANYTGMANWYGDLLFGDRKAKTDSLLLLQYEGGLLQEDDSFGIPVNRVLPLTTYEQAGELTREFFDGGATKLSIRYADLFAGGDRPKSVATTKPEGRLGGRGKYEEFLKEIKEWGIDFYPQLDFVRIFEKSGSRTTVTAIQGSPAVQYYYRHHTNKALMTEPYFLLTDAAQQKAVDRVIKEMQDDNWSGIDASTLGNLVYSDYRKDGITRQEASQKQAARLEGLKNAAGSLLLSGPGAYALPLADRVADLPLFDSGYLVCDETVPFYEIVCHGRVAAYTPALNRLADEQEGFLLAMEYGLGLQYALVAQNSVKAADSLQNPALGILADDWKETVLSRYAAAEDYLEQVLDQKILLHERVTQTVGHTVFTGGIEIYVNHGETDFETKSGEKISPGSYLILGMN